MMKVPGNLKGQNAASSRTNLKKSSKATTVNKPKASSRSMARKTVANDSIIQSQKADEEDSF